MQRKYIYFNCGDDNVLYPNVSASNLTRLMYLSTFCGKDNVLMYRSCIKSQLKVAKKQWYCFWREMVTNNILREQDGLVYICSDFSTTSQSDSIKLSIEHIRQLYISDVSYKQLSYVFRIMPMVNQYTNVMCFDPKEEDVIRVRKMKPSDFYRKIEYKVSQGSRLAKDLIEITIDGNPIIDFDTMTVNPKLYCNSKYNP